MRSIDRSRIVTGAPSPRQRPQRRSRRLHPPTITTRPGATPGDTAEQQAPAALRLLQEVRTGLRGQPACDLRHRREQRQRRCPASRSRGHSVRIPESTSARVNGSIRRDAAGRRRGSGPRATGGTPRRSPPSTLRTRPSAPTSSTETIRLPTRSDASSGNALPAPAPVSTITSWPPLISSKAPAGASATRYCPA